ncbi:MAG: CoB--CoM heterodisulfide reductase iron-sulfur subunit A family protein [Deltaproteobacteria bacterium]|nr:CoB--CoM heterodisulfide reductase iron-sulfur subunit A family protein [Deltaproteobacteria bacterium]MBW2121152.1 CoB--CoM heterodisulfide reductase iron-sulfur subunit A family protein [Deltaproteobacteria bacterium]
MKIGVYICHCGVNIADHVDVEAVRDAAKAEPHVAIARDYTYMCSDPGQDLIARDIESEKLDRIVVAACSPNMHERTFRNVLSKAGLNPYLLEIANIREHCSWVHTDREKATAKAIDLVLAALAKLRLLEPLETEERGVTPACLVIGGGIAGIQAALDIAASGFQAHLVEREPFVGGHVARLDRTFPYLEEAEGLIRPRVEALLSHPRINVMTLSQVETVEGSIGEFRVGVRRKPRYVDTQKCEACGECLKACPVDVVSQDRVEPQTRKAIYLPSPSGPGSFPVVDPNACLRLQGQTCDLCERACPVEAIDFAQEEHTEELKAGAIVVATGHDHFDATEKGEFGYGRYDRLITAPQMESLMSRGVSEGGEFSIGGSVPKTVAFIQCVGSRDKKVGNEYCSRVCCAYTAKQALWVRDQIPDSEVTVFYIDVRTFGKGYEELYEKAQKKGVIYTKGIPSEIFKSGGKLVLRGEDGLLARPYEKAFDLVILSTGLVPSKGAGNLRAVLKLSLSSDGFFMEAHPKLRPLDTASDGIFLAGTCQGPKDIADTLAQAHGAASRAATVLFRGKVAIDPVIASVDDQICSGCGICEGICEYGALKLEPYTGKMTVNRALCKGCGACNSACPNGAISLRHFRADQILAQVYSLCLGW